MFEINNGITKIDGSKGIYDNKVTDPSVRYGRNAVENYYTYLEYPMINNNLNMAPILDFGLSQDTLENNAKKIDNFLEENNKYLNALPPLKYEYRYMPNLSQGQIDKKAVLGAAYEEMGKVKEMSVEDMDDRFALDETFTSKALDVNKDGKIDIAEYGASFLASDMLSKSDIPSAENIDGTINKQGFDAVLAYAQKSNIDAASKMYSDINNKFNLKEELDGFNAE